MSEFNINKQQMFFSYNSFGRINCMTSPASLTLDTTGAVIEIFTLFFLETTGAVILTGTDSSLKGVEPTPMYRASLPKPLLP